MSVTASHGTTVSRANEKPAVSSIQMLLHNANIPHEISSSFIEVVMLQFDKQWWVALILDDHRVQSALKLVPSETWDELCPCCSLVTKKLTIHYIVAQLYNLTK